MRLIRISLALLLLAAGNALCDRGMAMLAAYRAAYGTPRLAPARWSAAELILLVSILGVGIAGVWVGMVWRAMP